MGAAVLPDRQLVRLLVTTTRASAFSTRASMNSGPCGWAHRSRIGRATPLRPRFETFPFPEGLTPDIPAADYADDPRAQKIAAAVAA